MSTPQSEEDGIVREWAPLSKLLGQIPLTIRKGLFFEDVKFTCADAVSDSIVIGTNVGLVFWYDRNDHKVERLSTEKSGHPITAVKIVSTVDFMVAAGDTNGVVSIFKIPKFLPNWLFNEGSAPQERKIERFTVGNLHISHITTLEWSMNGQKLFSGDSSGRVIFTEIDFFLNLTKAREILNENFTIVQLSYNQHLSALVVATIHRCIICFKDSPNWRILQIGQKERSCLAELGGVFFNNEIGMEPVILSCRPGLRLWQADINGNVQKTIIFKDAVKNCKNEIPLLNNIATCSSSSNGSHEFGKIYPMSDGLVVSQSRSDLLVMNISSVTVKAKLSFPRLISACSTSSEIFIIPSDRDLIRLSFTHDNHDSSLSREGNMATAESVSSLPSFNLLPITGTLLENISDSRPLSMPCEVMYGQDSAILPPIVPIQEGVAELRLENTQRHVFPSIGLQQYDDIIYRDNKRTNKNKRWRRSYEEQKSNNPIGKLWNSLSGPDDIPFINSVEETLVELAMEVPSDFLSDTINLDKIIQDAKLQTQIEEDSSAMNNEKTPDIGNPPQDMSSQLVHHTSEETTPHEMLPNLKNEVNDHNEEILNCNEILSESVCEENKYFESITNENQIVPQNEHFAESPPGSIADEQSPISLLNDIDSMKKEFELEPESINRNINIVSDSNANETLKDKCPEEFKTIKLDESSMSETVCKSLLEAFQNQPDDENCLVEGGEISGTPEKQVIEKVILDDANTSRDSIKNSYFDPNEKNNTLECHEDETKDIDSDLLCDDNRHSPSLESIENDKNSATETSALESISIDRSPLFSRISECEELTDFYVIRREISEESKKKMHPWLTSLIDIGDGWKELQCPDRCISVSANDEEVVICTPELIAYCLVYHNWDKLESCAELIDIAPSATQVATVNCGVAHYSKRLSGCEWTLLGREVEHISVDDKGIWYISRSELFFLPAGMHTAKKVNTNPFTLVKIYSHNETIAGITKEGEVVKFIGEFNRNWQLVMTSDSVKDLAFGPGKLAWFLNKHNNLFVSDNFTLPPDVTKWWQVVIGNGFMVDVGAIHSSEDCLYICDSAKPLMYINKSIVKGHQWEYSEFELSCSQISAENLLEDKGAIWILTKGNQLFCGFEQPLNIMEVAAPWKIVCMTCTPHALWLLSEEGSVHIRQGITEANPMGTHWSDLNLEQINDKNMQLVHISCGWDVVWACDIRGHVLMTVSSPHNITDDDMFSPAWVLVDGTPLHNNTFTKVYVGADSHMVWALDSAGNLYVREAIFPEFPVGANWVHVPGIKASHLCISSGAVWALTNECIYKRVGITQNNYIGDSWILIPGLFDHISVSGINQLWGIKSSVGHLMKHLEKIFSLYHEPYSDSSSEWTFV